VDFLKKVIRLTGAKIDLREMPGDILGGGWRGAWRCLKMLQMVRRMKERLRSGKRAVGDIGLRGSPDLVRLIGINF